ncbi:unnamed protein product [Mytilus edulis]|uniref:Uncharacterized protein n=1 Tax=Mytilus edulis TaxID=6550 RepID=A0A8S3TXM8_MYTED|nr:unnamed protein product [Mytilus edulis]
MLDNNQSHKYRASGFLHPVCTSFPPELTANHWVSETNIGTLTFQINTAGEGDVTLNDPNNPLVRDFTCVSSTDNVYVFRSEVVPMSLPDGSDGWFYLCMRINKVTVNSFSLQLLTDVSSFPLLRSPSLASTTSTCEFCQSGTSQVFILRRSGTSELIPTPVPVCAPCTKTQAECDTPPTTQAAVPTEQSIPNIISPIATIPAEQSVPNNVSPIASNSQVSDPGNAFVDAIQVLLAIVGIEVRRNMF